MSFVVIGINHKHSPIEVREQMYLTPVQQALVLSELKNTPPITEACVLSTCNRTEIYVYTIDTGMEWESLVHMICRVKNIPFSPRFIGHFYRFAGREAVRHLLNVASGLDSLVLGEDQILGQVKDAFDKAREAGMLNRRLNILSNIVIQTGKKVRHETLIGKGGSSISWAAVVKAEKILGDLSALSILVIGAGKMSELAVGHIQNRKFKNLYLMNRTREAALALAKKHGGEAAAFCDLKEVLSCVDLCICSAGAPHYLVERDIVERVMAVRGNRRLILIDISMPRNIDPDVAFVKNVTLLEIDDLKEVVDASLNDRAHSVAKVQAIVDRKIDEYYSKLKDLPNAEELMISE